MRVLKIRSAQPRRFRNACEQRGYCGPFANEEFYNEMPGWEGMGDCVHCARTRSVAQRNATWYNSESAA